MSFEVSKFETVKKTKLERESFDVSCNIETGVEMEKVLQASYSPCIKSTEVLDGVINFSGEICVNVMFLTVDGQIESAKGECSFVSKIENKKIKNGDFAKISAYIEGCEVVSVSNGSVKLKLQVCTQTTLISKVDVNKVDSQDQDVCQKTEEIEIEKFVGCANETFVVESKIAIKDNIKKLILSDSQVYVKSVDCGEGYVSASGEVVTKVLYLSMDEKFETCTVSEGFKEEIDLDKVTKESISEVDLSVLHSQIKCDIKTDEKESRIDFQIPVKMSVCAFSKLIETIGSDIYSTTKELELNCEKFDMTKKCETEFFESKIDGTLTLDDDKPRVDKLTFVGPTNLNVTNSYVKGGEVFVEGIATTGTIYLNDEANSLFGVDVEVPFVVFDKVKIDCEDAQVEICATILDCDVVVKRGREFYFDAKLKIKAEFHCDKEENVISGIVEKSIYPEKDCAIEVYFASENEDSWDIAKQLKVKQDMIFSQNPELVFPLNKEQNIVLFHQKRA